jgi:hypothetical protein
MADLRSLFPTSQIQGGAATRLELVYVYNTSISSAQNGGRCCLWTVPSGALWATFEVWGGGSDGPGGCCCMQPSQSGGAGAYGRRTISVTPGAQYTICAAGSGCCSPNCCGTEGFPSFVQVNAGAMVICAQGGPPSCARCFTGYDSGCAIISNSLIRCGSVFCADFGICAVSGAAGGGSCGFNFTQYVPEGPILGGGAKHGRDVCIILSGCNHIGGVATFPGGGGGGATTSGGCCWGGHGAGGLVIITYR